MIGSMKPSLQWLKKLSKNSKECRLLGENRFLPQKVVNEMYAPFFFRIDATYDEKLKRVDIVRVDESTHDDIDEYPFPAMVGTNFMKLIKRDGLDLGRVLWTKWYSLSILTGVMRLFVWEAKVVPLEGEVCALHDGIFIIVTQKRKFRGVDGKKPIIRGVKKKKRKTKK